jgi:hypothetical protein
MLARLAAAFPMLLLAAGCGGGAAEQAGPVSPPPQATASADATKPSGEDEAQKQEAAIAALTGEEAKTGQCDAEHKAALEKLLAEVEAGMKSKTGDDGKPLGMVTIDKRVIALGPNPKGVAMTVSGRGTEIHVLAMGLREPSMDVLAGGTAATTMRSPYQRTATATPATLELAKVGKVTELQSDSRQIEIKPGQPLEVKIRGEGCAILAAFQKP